ncbi:unnamed protein product [Anisakis simplex]|uniref:Ovule protein n=1 Tax=Anisakis simplex TaxID=6269 RepID=A0A0M3JFG8_ANISI|nr:unnamed protein product [Anisakis simplex]
MIEVVEVYRRSVVDSRRVARLIEVVHREVVMIVWELFGDLFNTLLCDDIIPVYGIFTIYSPNVVIFQFLIDFKQCSGSLFNDR